LDVLTDDLTASAKEKEKAATPDVTLNPPAEKQAVQPKAEKPKAQKPKTAKKKPARTKKAIKAQKPKQPTKPAVKQPEKPAAKYEVKENGPGDAHDKLKPRANPVPVVKVLPVAPVPVAEKTKPAESEPQTAPAEPMLSKHFLAQQEIEERASRERAAKVLEVLKQSQSDLKADAVPETPKTAKADTSAETREAVKWSVVPVIKKMTPKERSAFLVKEVPEESATAKAVSKNKNLRSILVFRGDSIDLTDEMQTEMKSLAAEVGKTKNSRVLLLSYSRPSSERIGGERQISLRRALAVRSALSRAGISSLRIEIRSQATKGAGDKLPNRVDVLIDG